MNDNLLHFTEEAASRRRHPTVADVDLTPEHDEDEGYADLDATFDQLAETTNRLHSMLTEQHRRTPKTDHMLLIAAVSTGFAIASLFWLLLLIAGVVGARP